MLQDQELQEWQLDKLLMLLVLYHLLKKWRMKKTMMNLWRKQEVQLKIHLEKLLLLKKNKIIVNKNQTKKSKLLIKKSKLMNYSKDTSRQSLLSILIRRNLCSNSLMILKTTTVKLVWIKFGRNSCLYQTNKFFKRVQMNLSLKIKHSYSL